MELKTNETNYSYDNETEKTYSNPNDALFGNMGEDTPYKISNTYSSSKPKINSSTNVIIAVALVIICIGCAVFFYKQTHKYDGKYVLEKFNYGGYVITVEEAEQLYALEYGTSIDINASIDVNGKKAYMIVQYYNNDEGYVEIKIDGNEVVLEDRGEKIYGTYDATNKTITLDTYGADLIFKKIN